MSTIDSSRRKLLLCGSAAAGLALLPASARASLSTSRPRVLMLNNLHTGETLKTEFFNGKSYDKDELSRLNHFFRDYRANKVKSSNRNEGRDNNRKGGGGGKFRHGGGGGRNKNFKKRRP